MKQNAAKEALELVRDGMVLGLGSGTTVNIFLDLLYDKIMREEIEVYFIPTSMDVETKLLRYGLKIVSLNEYPEPSIAIDGADIVTKKLELIKGGGGALTREKIVDYSAEEYYIIVDETKIRESLFESKVPIETLPFCWVKVSNILIKEFKAKNELRYCHKGKLGPVVTDNGNFIIDAYFEDSYDPIMLEKEIKNIPGVLENGIFAVKKPKRIIVGKENSTTILQ
ncbi:MAG: ribose 5-phosphate isomerase A [Thermoprotei archaeon]|nr:MAG: ribose 5-phosphate isomerase A [Thermoprotei archaeon]